jgi:hypothetical protein
MAVITSYETLQTAVADYCARSDLATFTPNFIQNWEEGFYRQPLNWGPWMETALSVTMSSGVATLPSDYLGLKWAAIEASPNRTLERKSAQQLYARFPRNNGSGKPAWIARDQGTFVFGPEPDSDYTIVGAYYAKPVLLRNDSDGINWMITNAPDLCLFGALLEAEPFLKNDSRIALWLDRYSDALVAYRDLIRDEDNMGSAMQAALA